MPVCVCCVNRGATKLGFRFNLLLFVCLLACQVSHRTSRFQGATASFHARKYQYSTSREMIKEENISEREGGGCVGRPGCLR
ncbi:hypothetical protein LX36DRAFT_262343 [Colletotrichum falcatum]|nr:hypothetical protein LX36DRAFT_262343 [Colletotrichum falcatum]